MQSSSGHACWQCGTVISASGGRCPICGAEQPDGAATSTGAPSSPFGRAPLPSEPFDPPASARKALPWVVLGGGLAALGVVAALYSSRHGDAAPSAPVASSAKPAAVALPLDPNQIRVPDPENADAVELLPQVKARAFAWSSDALLVSVRAAPIANGRVNLQNGGTIEYTFGTPSHERLGRFSRVAGKGFAVTLTSAGTTALPTPPRDGLAALEPTCPLDEAETHAEAAGVPKGPNTVATYEVSETYQKAVWLITVPNNAAASRTIDGWSCAILVR